MYRYAVPPSNSPRSSKDSFAQKVALALSLGIMLAMVMYAVGLFIYDGAWLTYTKHHAIILSRNSYSLPHSGTVCTAKVFVAEKDGYVTVSCDAKVGDKIEVKISESRYLKQPVFRAVQ